ncbi:hypothetical protein [Nesterenkonia populi]|uniref:hypothetical protein n=1 Tax=Nesterenkonia populi TaxID=1591087 RepID=UPI0011BF3411|nr:hypothetical protein [Nesterenkonia populi]
MSKVGDASRRPVLWGISCAGLLVLGPLLALLLGWLWFMFGDGVRWQAWQLERASDDDLLADVEVTVERRGDGPFPPRTITAFEATVHSDADLHEVGAHMEELQERYGRTPDLELENGTEIRDLERRGTAGELPAEGWTDVLSHAHQDHVDEIFIFGSDDGSTGVTLRRLTDEEDESAPSSADTLLSWAELTAPAGADRFSFGVEGGYLRQRTVHEDDGTMNFGESSLHPDYGIFVLDFSVEVEYAELAVSLLEAAQEEDRWDGVQEFELSLGSDYGKLNVAANDEDQRSGVPSSEVEPTQEMIEAAEDYAELAQSATEQQLEIRIGLFDTQPSSLMAEHESED